MKVLILLFLCSCVANQPRLEKKDFKKYRKKYDCKLNK